MLEKVLEQTKTRGHHNQRTRSLAWLQIESAMNSYIQTFDTSSAYALYDCMLNYYPHTKYETIEKRALKNFSKKHRELWLNQKVIIWSEIQESNTNVTQQ